VRLSGIAVLAVLALWLVPMASAQAGSAPRLEAAWKRFAETFRAAAARDGIVGGSLVLVQDGEVAARAVHGLADRQSRLAVDDDTIFHWASITKTLTGIAVLQLRDRGQLSLDDPVVKYLPELRQVHDPFGDTSEITIRHVLSHSAGFRDPTWPWGGDKDWHPFEPTRWDQVVAMFPYTEVLFRPGRRYSYSNPAIIFLGQIIERLTGDDYEVYVDKNILKPLEMHRSFYNRAPYHLVAHRSHSYFLDGSGLKEGRFDFHTGITTSNGGLNAPLGDMAKYLAFLMGRDDRRERYEGVLRRASLEEMWRPVLPVSEDPGGRVSIGLAFFLEHRGGLDLVTHSGTQNGFISRFYLHPASRRGWIVVFNTEDTREGEPTRKLDAELRDELLKSVFPVLGGR
jgi:CubicO group peptidase (beta-lactamase class C family)